MVCFSYDHAECTQGIDRCSVLHNGQGQHNEEEGREACVGEERTERDEKGKERIGQTKTERKNGQRGKRRGNKRKRGEERKKGKEKKRERKERKGKEKKGKEKNRKKRRREKERQTKYQNASGLSLQPQPIPRIHHFVYLLLYILSLYPPPSLLLILRWWSMRQWLQVVHTLQPSQVAGHHASDRSTPALLPSPSARAAAPHYPVLDASTYPRIHHFVYLLLYILSLYPPPSLLLILRWWSMRQWLQVVHTLQPSQVPAIMPVTGQPLPSDSSSSQPSPEQSVGQNVPMIPNPWSCQANESSSELLGATLTAPAGLIKPSCHLSAARSSQSPGLVSDTLKMRMHNLKPDHCAKFETVYGKRMGDLVGLEWCRKQCVDPITSLLIASAVGCWSCCAYVKVACKFK